MQFSIIIPAFNAKDTIEAAISSVLTQDFNDFEIVIIDDGSVDGTFEFVKTKYADNKSIKLARQDNQGVAVARNMGIKMSSGDWITFLDSDDTLEKDCLKKIYEIIKKNDGIDVIIGHLIEKTKTARVLDKSQYDGVFTGMDRIKLIESSMSLDLCRFKYKIVDNCRCIGAKVYKRSSLINHEIEFPPNIKVFEDGIFNLYAYYFSNQIYITKQVIYKYNRSDNSATRTYDDSKEHQYYKILNLIREFIIRFDLQKQLKPAFEYCQYELFYNRFENIAKRSNKICGYNTIKEELITISSFNEITPRYLSKKRGIAFRIIRTKSTLLVVLYLYICGLYYILKR